MMMDGVKATTLLTDILEYRLRLLERLEQQMADYVVLGATVPEAEWHTRTTPYGLTWHKVLARVRAAEAGAFIPRINQILDEDTPRLEAYTEENWVDTGYQMDEPLTSLLDDVTHQRRVLLTRLHTLSSEAWARRGFHAPSGLRTTQWWTEQMYLHANRYLNDLRGGPRGP